MSSQTTLIIAVIAVTSGVTIILRALPFLLFSSGKKCPPVITFIGKVLSPAAIAMLIIYCLVSPYNEKTFAAGGFGIPEGAGSLVVITLHLLKGNPLLSIAAGTAVYMCITQLFF